MIKIFRLLALVLLSLFFIAAGIGHFTNTDFFLAIVPPYLPWHLALVYISGFFEILGGLGILIPAIRTLAGYGLIALLIAVFPANIHMAINPQQFEQMSPTALYVRLPLQFVLIALVWWATKTPKTRS